MKRAQLNFLISKMKELTVLTYKWESITASCQTFTDFLDVP